MPSYRSIVADGRWRRFAVASLAARLPITMAAFGLILVGRAFGSYAFGARLAALYTVTAAACALWQGRSLDRRDLRHGLVRQGVAVTATAAALAAAVDRHGPRWLAVVLAVALGVAIAAVGGGYRALLPRALPHTDLEVASALDAVCVEVCFVLGPAVAGAVAWFAGPTGVFAVLAGCAAAGAAATTRLPPTPPHPRPRQEARPSLYRHPEVVAVLAGTLGLGCALGVFDGSFPALAAAVGSRASFGGALVATMALGSAAGGLVAGHRLGRRADVGRCCTALLALFGLLALPVALAPDVPAAVVATLVGGAPFALMSTGASLIIQRTVAPSRATEAFCVLNATVLAGAAVGNALVSALIGPAGVRGTVAVAAVGPVGVAAVLVVAIAVRARRGGRSPATAAPTRGRDRPAAPAGR